MRPSAITWNPLTDEEVSCRCGRYHQPRERAVLCRECRRPTLDVHAVCEACQR